MSTTIEYFFTMASPWAYLGHGRFIDLARRHGVRIAYRPVPLGRLFPETGGLPLPQRHPVRQRYRLVELSRWSDHLGLPLSLHPAHWPFDPTRADRTVIAIAEGGTDPADFMARVFRGIWAEQRDLADPATIAAIATEAGVPADLLARAEDPATAKSYDANLEAAMEADVFGAPTYVLNGEPFWGQDRLDLLDAALASGRPPVTLPTS